MSGARCLHALARAFPQLDVRDEREVSQHGSTIERIACWGATTPRAQVRLIVIAILGSWMFLRAVGYSPARAAVLPMRAFVSATLFERFFSFCPPFLVEMFEKRKQLIRIHKSLGSERFLPGETLLQ